VAFVGKDTSEYVGETPGGRAARAVMRRMAEAKRYVCGVCAGQRVLAEAGVLRNKKAAWNSIVGPRFPPETSAIDWQQLGVVVDGQVVTAGLYTNALEFAQELMEVIRMR
jgi:putative intracellular protease/amidase